MLTTDNLKLPLYEPTDLADLTDGYNSAMNILDENDSALAENISTTADKITNGYKAADIEIKNEIKDINAIVTDHETLISNNTKNITSLLNKFKFSYKTYTSNDMTIITNNTGGEINTEITTITLAYNSDFSLFKLYGQFCLKNVTTAGLFHAAIKCPVPFNDSYTIGPTGNFNDNSKGINYGYSYFTLDSDNQQIILKGYFRPYSGNGIQYFMPSLYINSNFGDQDEAGALY